MILLLPSDLRLQRGPVVGNAQKTTGNPYVSSMATTGYHAHPFQPHAIINCQFQNDYSSTTTRGKNLSKSEGN